MIEASGVAGADLPSKLADEFPAPTLKDPIRPESSGDSRIDKLCHGPDHTAVIDGDKYG
jgi:hypothetical protein